MDVKFDEAISVLPINFKQILNNIPETIKEKACELRLRSNRPIIINCPNQKIEINKKLNSKEINDCFLSLCNYSIHSHLNEIKQGFLTIKGGHRAGFCATAVYDSFGHISNLKQISSINIRIARQIKNLTKTIVNQLHNKLGKLLIVGPPASGKTTILKAIVKHLSNKNVSIIDTRGEIAACFDSIAQNDVGNADIFNLWNRSDGILAAIKTMNPDYIVCDEIGTKADLDAINLSVGSGVELIATAHGENVNDFKNRPFIEPILQTNAFEHIVFLKSKEEPCEINEIIKVSDLF